MTHNQKFTGCLMSLPLLQKKLLKINSLASHRGYGKKGIIPENTLPAFLASAKEGFLIHELDVRMTKDKKVVLFHGPRLEQQSDGSGRVEEKTLLELQQYNMGDYLKEKKFFRITTLYEFLIATRKKIFTNIELKRDWWDFSQGLEDAVLAAVQDAKCEQTVFFSSFNLITLYRLRKKNTGIPIGLLLEPGLFFELRERIYSFLIKPDAIHPHYSSINNLRLRRWKKKNLPVITWTVNESTLARKLLAEGVNIVITDNIQLIHIL